MSTLGRIVLLIWLFVVLIINSSYTASLTSILTVQQLYSPIKGIETLVNSKDPVGYKQGSFAKNYLIHEIGIDESRLVPLKTPEECAKALKKGPLNGGVVAYVDERAYIDIFLSTRCNFTVVGQEFTRNGWGFVSILPLMLLVFFVFTTCSLQIYFVPCHFVFPLLTRNHRYFFFLKYSAQWIFLQLILTISSLIEVCLVLHFSSGLSPGLTTSD